MTVIPSADQNDRNLRPHLNVLLTLGVCSNPQHPLCILTGGLSDNMSYAFLIRFDSEFMPNGNLYQLLHSETKIPNSPKSKILSGIAAGMLHLAREGIVHRGKFIHFITEGPFESHFADPAAR